MQKDIKHFLHFRFFFKILIVVKSAAAVQLQRMQEYRSSETAA
jgi:hypothetical protein